jgi:hypothetical protein
MSLLSLAVGIDGSISSGLIGRRGKMPEANASPSSGCSGKEDEAPELIEPAWPYDLKGEDIVAEIFDVSV